MDAASTTLGLTAAGLTATFFSKSVEELGKTTVDLGVKGLTKLVSKLREIFAEDTSSTSALNVLANNPNDPSAKSEVADAVDKATQKDRTFRDEILEILGEVATCQTQVPFTNEVRRNLDGLIAVQTNYGQVKGSGDFTFKAETIYINGVGTANENTFALDKNIVSKRIGLIDDPVKLKENTGEDIDIFVISQRFGRKVKATVPPAIRASALAEILVDLLKLPRNYRVEELSLELVFKYTIVFKGERIGPWSPLNGAGVKAGSEVEILIEFGWKDPISPKPDKVNWGTGKMVYHVVTPKFFR